MSKQKILALLHRSEDYLSGEEMSRVLGVSRAAIWKAVEGLRQEGYEIDSLPRRGYRLVSAPDHLSEGEILPYLHTRLLASRLEVFSEIDSTNSYLKRSAHTLPDGAAVIADRQTGGRGRLGRSFTSPPGLGVYCSVLLRPQMCPVQAVNLTAWAAVAACDAIERVCGLRPGIKWTNDLILNGRKVCGILTEMSVEGESGALQHIVLGVGINANQRREHWSEELAEIAGSVAEAAGRSVRRGQLAATLLNALDEMYADFAAGRRARWLDRYRQDCLTVGREVRLISPRGTENAFALAIDDDFRLVVRLSDGTERTVSSGEVSVRGMLGYL